MMTGKEAYQRFYESTEMNISEAMQAVVDAVVKEEREAVILCLRAAGGGTCNVLADAIAAGKHHTPPSKTPGQDMLDVWKAAYTKSMGKDGRADVAVQAGIAAVLAHAKEQP